MGGVGLFLCPSPAETPEMGLVRFLNGICAFLDDRVYLLRNYAFEPKEAVAYLERFANQQTRHIFGPPALISRFLRYLEQNNIRVSLDPRSYVVTTGGWTRHTGENLQREAFTQSLQTYLGVRPENVRDIYGIIEANLFGFECEHHRKHTSPWCHVSVRDLRDLSQEMPVGRTGVIAILDAMSGSYPGFLLTEDVGKIEQDGECPCGRIGQTISFNRRLRGAEVGCCAVSIEKFMESHEIVAECALPQA
jgi:long-chain-fatty-acid---luciferin-component ligase